MALDLFKKTDSSHRGLLAIEKAALGYNLLTSVLIVVLLRRMDHPAQMLISRIQIAGVTFLLAWLYHFVPCKCFAFIRVTFQMTLLSFWYSDTYEFNRLFSNQDHAFAYIEQWIFGCQPSILFSQYFPQMWVSELLNMGYFSYYPMLAVVVIYHLFYRYELFEKISFMLITSFFICYFIYLFLPVAGPQFYFPAIGCDNALQGIFPSLGDYFTYHPDLLSGPGHQGGLFYRLVEMSQQTGERPTAAFPSSHVGVSTIMMIMAWRGSKKLFVVLAPLYTLLCGATVYIQAHYLIDSIAGFTFAFGLYALASKMFEKWKFVRSTVKFSGKDLR
jgi:membrane-associated phospholipid phosphatase